MGERMDDRTAAAFDVYVDRLVGGAMHPDGDGADLGALDPALAETARRYHALGQTAAPTGARERVRRRLASGGEWSARGAEAPTYRVYAIGTASAIGGPIGRAAGTGDGSTSVRAAGSDRWALAQFATAALLLLTLGIGLFSLGPWRRAAPAPASRLLPAVDIGPAAAVRLEFLWRSTGGPEPLDEPFGVGVAPDGAVWVSDGRNDRFQIFSPDGTYRETWGESGAADGEFEFLADYGYVHHTGDVAFDAAGNLYVADTGNARIQKFGPDRAFLRAWGSEGKGEGQFVSPSAIAVGPDGSVYVGDAGRSVVQRFDPDGRYLETIGSSAIGRELGKLSLAAGIAVDGAGDLWVADAGNARIQRFRNPAAEPLLDAADGVTAWGEYGQGTDQLNRPGDVAVDPQGRVYVTDEDRGHLQVFTAAGRFLTVVGSARTDRGPFEGGTLCVAIGADGLVYVTDAVSVHAFRLVPA